jgi:hypothetical protein
MLSLMPRVASELFGCKYSLYDQAPFFDIVACRESGFNLTTKPFFEIAHVGEKGYELEYEKYS